MSTTIPDTTDDASCTPAARPHLGSIALGGGCLWFSWIALTRTDRVAARVGICEDETRALGYRDLGSGLSLMLPLDPRPALAARMIFDSTDALHLVRRSKFGAALAAIYFVLDILAWRRARSR